MGGNGSDSFEDFDGGRQRLQLMYTICFIVTGLLALLGLVGNIVSFCTFGKMPNSATTFLLRALAVFDSGLLLLNASLYAMRWAEKLSVLLIFTQIYIVSTSHIFYVAVVWTSVIIGMNRYIAVCRPLQAARLCTTDRARKQLVCIVLFSIVYALPRFFRYKLTKAADGSEYEIPFLIDDKIWYEYFYIVGCEMIFRFVIPFAMLLFFCVRLITTLRAARRQPLDLHGGPRVETRVTLMLVTLLGIFLICNAPNFIHNSLMIILMHDFQFATSWANILAFYIADILTIFNSSCNWVIYFAYMKEFRKKQCLGCTRFWNQNQDHELTRITVYVSSGIAWFLTIYGIYHCRIIGKYQCISTVRRTLRANTYVEEDDFWYLQN